MTLEEISIKIDNGDDIAVHCDTEEKAIKLLSMCKNKNMKWGTSGREIFTEAGKKGYWDRHKSDTLYYLKGLGVTYGSLNYCSFFLEKYVEFDDEEENLCKSDYSISFLFD